MEEQERDWLEPISLFISRSKNDAEENHSVLTAQVYDKGIEIDLNGFDYIYEWFFSSFDKNGCTGKPFGTGKHLAIDSQKLGRHCNFQVTIRKAINQAESFYANPDFPTI